MSHVILQTTAILLAPYCPRALFPPTATERRQKRSPARPSENFSPPSLAIGPHVIDARKPLYVTRQATSLEELVSDGRKSSRLETMQRKTLESSLYSPALAPKYHLISN
ncbi:unnamed protein product, partial [Iphiclides podalirius]